MRAASEILLVDDNPADLDLTIDALAQSQWRTNVNTVSDGEEAMTYLRREGCCIHTAPLGFAGPQSAPQGWTFGSG